jgi:hypothetical protein
MIVQTEQMKNRLLLLKWIEASAITNNDTSFLSFLLKKKKSDSIWLSTPLT